MVRARRGDLFLFVLDILFLAVLIFLFWRIASAFTPERPDEVFGSRQAAMLRTYSAADAALLYLDVAARRETMNAIREVAKAGGVQDTRCGTYAGLQRWTAQGLSCFPDQGFIDALRAELQSRLRIAPSWIIPQMAYDIAILSEGDSLRISGEGMSEVTLPIIIVASGDPRAATIIIEGGAANTAPTLIPDAHVPLALRPIPGGVPRSGGVVTSIIVHSTGTADAAGALALYDRGVSGAHYLIDPDGRVTQLMREDLRARHLPECDEPCSIQDAEDESIAVALVLPSPTLPDDTCPEGTVGPVTATDWCDWIASATGCRSQITEMCWSRISRAQNDALVNLVADIARRRAISPSPQTVLLAEQVTSAPGFGPGVVPAGIEVDARSWWASFIAAVQASAATPSADAPVSGSAGAPRLALPVAGDGLRVSSCYGYRLVGGQRDRHDGIDFAGGDLPVLAAADGAVYATCSAGTCDAPLTDRAFGNNVIIAHDGGVFTRYSHLKAVSVRKGDRVRQGQRIGDSGSTGRSTGAHLDFKVYLSRDDIPEIGGEVDRAVEPLCFFSQSDFQRFTLDMSSESCRPYGTATLTADNDALRAKCAGFDVQPSGACGIGTLPAVDDPDVRITIGRLDSLGARATVASEAAANGVDELLVMAVITQESKGNPDAVSATGCAGLGQFCMSTATSDAFAGIFGPGVRRCDCPGTGSCTADAAGCAGDPRLDPIKSARAIPLHLRLDAEGPFVKYTDKWRFAIAAYNAGGGNVRAAIRASGRADPLWEDVVPYLRGTGMGVAKTEEVVTYVAKVTGYWRALGGDAAPALAGVTCATSDETVARVREVGSFTFRPSFSVTVADGLAPLAGVAATARQLAESCDGSGGTDPNACLEDGAQRSFGDRLVACVGEKEVALQDLREFVADCLGSDQQGCGCAWKPPDLPDGVASARLDLYGTDARLSLIGDDGEERIVGASPAGARITRIAALPTLAARDGIMSVRLDSDGGATLVQWGPSSRTPLGADGADDELTVLEETPVDRVLLRTDGAWLTGDAPACAPRKREHALCVDLGTTSEAGPLVARFALWLDDVEVPEPATDVKAANAGGYLAVSFRPSPSADVSHYRVWCAPEGTAIDEDEAYALVPGNTRSTVRFCNGRSVLTGSYAVRVVPYDIVGQRGAAAEAVTVSDEGWLGIVAGLVDGFSEEEFLDALVAYGAA